MAQRLQLQTLLKTLCENVYFQQPSNVKMIYPAIVYEIDFGKSTFADNKPYTTATRYKVTIIDRDPDSEIPAKVAALPMTSFDRRFTAYDMHHTVYNMYF